MNIIKAGLLTGWRPPTWIGIAIFLFQASAGSWAGPIPKNLALPEAKWVLHLDLEALKKTDLYQYLKRKDRLKDFADFSLFIDSQELKLDLTRCHSLTAFGMDWEFESDSVAGIVKLPNNYRQEMLSTLAMLAKGESSSLQPSQGKKAWNGYNLDEELYIYSPVKDTFVLGSEKVAWQLCGLASGQGATRLPACLADYSGKLEPFFTAAYAGEISEDASLPLHLDFNFDWPTGTTNSLGSVGEFIQHEVLKKIEGASLNVGEATNHFWMSLVLKTRTSENAGQLRQALNGMAAAGRLALSTNQPLQKILRRLTIATNKNTTILAITHPTQLDGHSLYELLEAQRNSNLAPGDPANPNKEKPSK